MTREELTKQIVEYLLEHGSADLSLRPLAKALGTSDRMLIYYFGTKEELLTSAMALVRQNIQSEMQSLAPECRTIEDLQTYLRNFWQWATANKNSRYLRLVYESYGLALQRQSTYSRYLTGANTTWLAALQRMLDKIDPAQPSTLLATTIMATVQGLLLDFLATGDMRRTTASLELFLGTLAAGKRRVKNRGLKT
jgi:AcrR family transcriptional regulator